MCWCLCIWWFCVRKERISVWKPEEWWWKVWKSENEIEKSVVRIASYSTHQREWAMLGLYRLSKFDHIFVKLVMKGKKLFYRITYGWDSFLHLWFLSSLHSSSECSPSLWRCVYRTHYTFPLFMPSRRSAVKLISMLLLGRVMRFFFELVCNHSKISYSLTWSIKLKIVPSSLTKDVKYLAFF